MSDSAIVTFALIAAIAGIAYGLYLAMWVFKLNAGNAKMQEIAKAIQEGAGAYMNRQYKTVGMVAAVLFVVLWGAGAVSDKFGMLTAIGFLIGAGASALGWHRVSRGIGAVHHDGAYVHGRTAGDGRYEEPALHLDRVPGHRPRGPVFGDRGDGRPCGVGYLAGDCVGPCHARHAECAAISAGKMAEYPGGRAQACGRVTPRPARLFVADNPAAGVYRFGIDPGSP